MWSNERTQVQGSTDQRTDANLSLRKVHRNTDQQKVHGKMLIQPETVQKLREIIRL